MTTLYVLRRVARPNVYALNTGVITRFVVTIIVFADVAEVHTTSYGPLETASVRFMYVVVNSVVVRAAAEVPDDEETDEKTKTRAHTHTHDKRYQRLRDT